MQHVVDLTERRKTLCKIMGEYKAEALIAAKELGYSREVIKRLRNAETEAEIERIMVSARKALPD